MPKPNYDVFLSHAGPDKVWVRSLAQALEDLGLTSFLDEVAIKPGDEFPVVLSDGIGHSRYLVLILSTHTADRAWVTKEWSAFIALHGPLGRILPVKIEPVEPPAIFAGTQAIQALGRDALAAAKEIAAVVGQPQALGSDDARSLVIAETFPFTIAFGDSDLLKITGPDGKPRSVTPPWHTDKRFAIAHRGFNQLTQQAVTDAQRAELQGHATVLGEILFGLLFDATALEQLQHATAPGRARPLVTIISDSDVLLSLPWELLHHEGLFLVRDARIDLARTVLQDVGAGALVPPETKDRAFKLVLNVSAPQDSGLDYEGESYRLTRALAAGDCTMVPTELGTLADLVETVKAQKPTGIHFSGHGSPASLSWDIKCRNQSRSETAHFHPALNAHDRADIRGIHVVQRDL